MAHLHQYACKPEQAFLNSSTVAKVVPILHSVAIAAALSSKVFSPAERKAWREADGRDRRRGRRWGPACIRHVINYGGAVGGALDGRYRHTGYVVAWGDIREGMFGGGEG